MIGRGLALAALLVCAAARSAGAQDRTKIKIGMFNFANAAYVASRPYDSRWPEKEAFALTAPSDPWR